MNEWMNKFSQLPSLIPDAGRITPLPEDETVWLVRKGNLDLYCIKQIDGSAESAGRLQYTATVKEGQLLLGPGTGAPYRAFYRAVAGTELLPADVAGFTKACSEEDTREDCVKAMEEWLNALRQAAEISMTGFSADQGAMQKPESGNVAGELEYSRFLYKCYFELLEKRLQFERDQFNARLVKEKKFVSKSIRNLADISKSVSKGGPAASESFANPLLEAFRLVGAKLSIKIAPVADDILHSSGNPIEDIAKTSKIRARRVSLEGEWWKEDCGPLIGFLGNGDPIALLPSGVTKYEMHNPTNGTVSPVDMESVKTINAYAFMLYRAFPAKKLNIKDLMMFISGGPTKRDSIILLAMGVLGGMLGTVSPLVSGVLFDTVIPEGQRGQLLQVIMLLLAVSVSILMFGIVRSFAMLRMESRLDGSVQAAVWDRLLGLPAPFFRNYTVGELASRAMGINQIRKKLSGMAVSTVLSSIFSIFNLLLLFRYNTQLALIAVLLTVISIAVTLVIGWTQLSSEGKLLALDNKLSGLMLQMLGGIAKLRTAGAENRAFYQWSTTFSKKNRIFFTRQTSSNILTTFNAVFSVFSAMVIFSLVAKSNMSMGAFIAFNAAYMSFQSGFLALSGVILDINIIIPMYNNIKPILEELPEYDDTRIDPGELDGSIEVSHVTFRYKEDGPLVLNDLSVRIEAGEYVAVVGTSGCGKSTLLRLLLGFEKAEGGRIFFGGHDMESIDIRSVRRQLGVVLQNGKLFAGDIYTNIVGSNPNMTMQDAWEAVRMAGMEEDIKGMPMGLHTVISEGATTISGGQKQRIMIARAIVKKPKILFFDEATSALDNRTQAIVSQSLDNLKATRIVIAHRLSTVMNCDRIIVMDKGSVAEQGSYQELMDKQGLFYQLAKRQLA